MIIAHRIAARALLLALLPALAAGQRAPQSFDSARYAATARELRGLRWRLVGPFRGGRAVAVVGDPTKPNLFYFGAVNGGVWKTTNAGASWANITDGKSNISSVGAIAIAPSD